MVGGPGRLLICAPILHTQADLGSLGEAVERQFVRRHGRGKWEEHMRAIESLWERLESAIEALNLDYARTRLYQDGLPICGKEETIVRELAAKGSRNHKLLLELTGRGCILTGTESPDLLLEEYQLNRSLLTERTNPLASRPENSEQARQLLQRRDRFIAQRITETLEAGNVGLIFLGLLHSLKGVLPTDIQLHLLEPTKSEGEPRDPARGTDHDPQGGS